MNFAVLTISDRSARGDREDLSGPALVNLIEENGDNIVFKKIIPDDKKMIVETLSALVSDADIDVILTTGGTGVAPRDVTPEATLEVIEKRIPGIAEVMRSESLKKTPHAVLSRAEAGVAGQCLIINLPGSPRGAQECLKSAYQAVRHAVELVHGRHPDK